MDEVIALTKGNDKKLKRNIKKTKDKVSKGQLALKSNVEVLNKLRKKPLKNVIFPKIDVTPANLKNPKAERGLIYVGHIPHGFYEDEMKKFFKQFGKVTNCRVNRSARTGASKGFGYVEFKNPEVAQIAGETMNNYLMFKRRLITKYIPANEQKVNIFRVPAWSKNNYPMKLSRRHAIRIYNNNTYVDYEKECRGMMKSVQIKVDKLKKMGITYDFKFNDIPDFITSTSKEADIEISAASEKECSYIEDSDDPSVQYKVPKRKSPRKVKKNVSPV